MILLAVMFGNMIDSLSVGHSPVYVCTHRHRRGAGAVATGRDASCTYGSNLELSCSESGVTVSVPFLSDDRSSAANSESGEKHHHTYSPVCNFERVVRRSHVYVGHTVRRPAPVMLKIHIVVSDESSHILSFHDRHFASILIVIFARFTFLIHLL